MAQISLLYPENSSQKTCEMTPQGINDLSIDYSVESLTKDVYEKNSIKNILTNVTSDIDVINYICKELGYKLEVIEMSFDGIIPALKSGKVDVSGCSIIVTEERKKSVLFSEPDYTGGIVVITRR